jgi:copper chaperone CopZ
MLSFPYYAKIFYPNISKRSVIIESQNLVSQDFSVNGMTCSGCEEHIKQAVSALPGIVSIATFHKTGKVSVQFDKTKLNTDTITATINSTGYKVKE